MTDVRINLEVSAQRLIEHVSINNAQIAAMIESQVKMACDRLEHIVNNPDFEKSVDAQIQEGVNKAIKDILSTYNMRQHIESCIKKLVEEKVKLLFNEEVRFK